MVKGPPAFGFVKMVLARVVAELVPDDRPDHLTDQVGGPHQGVRHDPTGQGAIFIPSNAADERTVELHGVSEGGGPLGGSEETLGLIHLIKDGLDL